MKNLEELLKKTWYDGFENGLNPGEKPDAFEEWIKTVDLKAWLIAGKLSLEPTGD